MTPASSDRYQSRLFRFVYKQSRRFTQQCDRAWRNLQSTASWVAAVGLYPLFLLLQSRRSTANQVNQALEETLLQLPAEEESIQEETPTVDTPIRQVLLYVTGVAESQKAKVKSQNLLTPHPSTLVASSRETRSQHWLPLTPHSIRGIASHLSSRSLVLVTAQNQTLDVLDPQQQQALQEEIIAAVAQYWQYRRRQNQSLAPAPLPLTSSPWLTSLDHTVAEVESHHLVRVKSAAIAFYQSIFSPSTELSSADSPATEVQASSSKTHTTRILSLIWAAIDYFFGTGDRATSPMTTDSRNEAPHLTGKTISAKPRFPATRPSARLPASHNSADEDLADPWLSASDLFGSDATTNDPPNPPYKEGQQSTPPISRLQNAGERRSLPKPQRGMRRIGTSAKISPPSSQQEMRGIGSVNRTLPPLKRGVGGIGTSANAAIHATTKGKQSLQKAETSNISHSAANNSSVQPAPDWIETPATLMGYVKHPLEQMLAWLDRAMLWLEETLFKFWQWMQKIWRKF